MTAATAYKGCIDVDMKPADSSHVELKCWRYTLRVKMLTLLAKAQAGAFVTIFFIWLVLTFQLRDCSIRHNGEGEGARC
jgi:hypothetical protein